jgi:hypothetical protein
MFSQVNHQLNQWFVLITFSEKETGLNHGPQFGPVWSSVLWTEPLNTIKDLWASSHIIKHF